MVEFVLIEEDDTRAIYEYYPENKKDKNGTLTLFKNDGHVEITKMASDDFSRYVPVEELKESRAFMNRLRLEEGEKPLSEEEWPIPIKGFTTTFYADHAVRKIKRAYKNGEILKRGVVIWY